MTSESKTMQEIHEIRLRNYEAEIKLTPDELANKRNADLLRAAKIIKEYNLNIKDMAV
jgi:hypothetical protein